jgi:monoamine oxidase
MAKTYLLRQMHRGLRDALRAEMRQPSIHPTPPKFVDGALKYHSGRRGFIKGTLSGVAGAGLTSCIAHRAGIPNVSGVRALRNMEPIIVIGGGIAGLTITHRLQQAGIPCAVFEGRSRVGGRILSKRNFNSEGMFCELGAELVDTNHLALINLAKELGLTLEAFEQDFNYWRSKNSALEAEVFHYQNKFYSHKDLVRGFAPLAKALIRDRARAETPEGLAALDRVSMRAYLENVTDLDAWIRSTIDIAYLGEMGLETDEQSCLNLITFIDANVADGFSMYGESDEAFRIRGGNSNLTESLYNRVKERTVVHLEHRLVAIRENGGALTLTFDNNGKTVEITTKAAVCTLPFTTLRHVDGVDKLGLTTGTKRAIAELGYGSNAKYMLGFKERFWYRKNQEFPATPMVYTDLPSQAFWDTSRLQAGNSGILTNFVGGKKGTMRSESDFSAIRDDLMRVFGGLSFDSLHDGNKALAAWPKDAFALGSYICPKVGQYGLIEQMQAVELGGILHFAGEHFGGDFAGFMNGAIQSGEETARALLARIGA